MWPAKSSSLEGGPVTQPPASIRSAAMHAGSSTRPADIIGPGLRTRARHHRAIHGMLDCSDNTHLCFAATDEWRNAGLVNP